MTILGKEFDKPSTSDMLGEWNKGELKPVIVENANWNKFDISKHLHPEW
jgi:hypothetical protein